MPKTQAWSKWYGGVLRTQFTFLECFDKVTIYLNMGKKFLR